MGDIVFGRKGDTVYGGKTVNYGSAPPPAARPVPARGTILLLSANADDQRQLALDQERRAIDQEVAHSRAAGRLDVRTADALRLDDLQRVLLRHRPVLAHFSGHGHPRDGIQVVGRDGWPRSVPPRALRDLFAILGEGLRCVVLNACHTDEQAEAIAAHVPCVVGMRRQVFDDTAILFATGFYRGLADGRSFRTSFELARNGLDLHDAPDPDVPRLIARAGAADRPLVDLR
ncbi:CHAT domain-containing protein [Actinoplanes siamensis]|nr:CHAT domain-containing protein [Actinoplanes siamensis]